MKHLPILLMTAALLCTPCAQAKPDVHKILGGLVQAGSQAVQQADNAAGSAADTLQQQLKGYKEAYKEEGRAYARELGDIMTERMLANKKIDRTLTSVRALCWGVVTYITLVSLLLFGMMLRIQALLRKLQKRAEKE